MKLWQMIVLALAALIVLYFVMSFLAKMIVWVVIIAVIIAIAAFFLKDKIPKVDETTVAKAAGKHMLKKLEKDLDAKLRDLEKSVGIKDEDERK